MLWAPTLPPACIAPPLLDAPPLWECSLVGLGKYPALFGMILRNRLDDLSAAPGVAAPPPLVLNIWRPDADVFRLLTGSERMLSVADTPPDIDDSMESEYGAPETAETWEFRRAGAAAWVEVTFCPSKLVLAALAVTVAEIS